MAAAARPGLTLLRILVLAGLLVDAYVHLHLAGRYQLIQPARIGEGNLFRIEAVVALLAAAYLMVSASRIAFGVAALTALGGAAAVVLYRYVDVAAIGPLPAMYEPIWFTEKTVSAVVEGLAGLLALYAAVAPARKRRPQL